MRQRGYVLWVVLAVLLAAVLGSWQYSKVRSERRLQAQQAAEAKALDDRREAERKETERRVAQEKEQRDALTTSLKAADDLLVRWDDAVKLASTSARVALSGPVSALQSIRRDAEQLTVPPCLDQARPILVQSMGNTIDGFLAFMRNELKLGDVLARGYLEDAAKQMATFKEGRAACPQ
jgi:type II secretory pathway pseudopilin PulG